MMIAGKGGKGEKGTLFYVRVGRPSEWHKIQKTLYQKLYTNSLCHILPQKIKGKKVAVNSALTVIFVGNC